MLLARLNLHCHYSSNCNYSTRLARIKKCFKTVGFWCALLNWKVTIVGSQLSKLSVIRTYQLTEHHLKPHPQQRRKVRTKKSNNY